MTAMTEMQVTHTGITYKNAYGDDKTVNVGEPLFDCVDGSRVQFVRMVDDNIVEVRGRDEEELPLTRRYRSHKQLFA